MNTYYIAGFPVSDELYHHGIKGQKWGIRHYQNEDGTLTPEGYKRYGKEMQRDLNKYDEQAAHFIGDHNKANTAKNRVDTKRQRIINKHTRADGSVELSNRQARKVEKLAERAKNLSEEMESSERKLKSIESKQWKIMGEAAKMGYSVLIEPASRSTIRKGEIFLNSLIYGPLGAGLKAYTDYGIGGDTTKGNKFKVKRNKSGKGEVKFGGWVN